MIIFIYFYMCVCNIVVMTIQSHHWRHCLVTRDDQFRLCIGKGRKRSYVPSDGILVTREILMPLSGTRLVDLQIVRRREGIKKGRSDLADKGGSHMKKVHAPRYRTRLFGISVECGRFMDQQEREVIYYFLLLLSKIMPVTRKEFIKRKKNRVERGE